MFVLLLLTGCAAQRAYREGNSLIARDDVASGLLKYREAIAADPWNAEYKAAYLRVRDAEAIRLLERADRELADSKNAVALQDYRRVIAIDPGNERASAGLRLIERDFRLAKMLNEASAAFEKNDYEGSREKLEAILAERPKHRQAQAMLGRIEDKKKETATALALSTAFRRPISLEFRDTPLRQVFEVIARHSGLNFVFDKEVRADQRASIFLKDSTVDAAIYFLLVTNQLERQVMDGNTILIYPKSAGKLKEYQQMSVKTYYVANADAKNVANTLKTILKMRDVVVDEKLNLIIVRDSLDAIGLANRLVALQDVAEPEVMLDVEVLEIKRNRITDFGIGWPANLSFAPLQSVDGHPLTIDQLRGLGARSVGVSGISASINAQKNDGDSNILANPRIRVRNKEKAQVVIGDMVPNITTTISPGAGGFATESVNYVDVGLTLKVEPTIYLNNEVAIKITLEVSDVIDSLTTKSGTVAYRIGTRSASTLLQLKDGENQVLAGLINNEERSSSNRLPGLGDLPLVGRLFGTTHDTDDKTEIVLSITPHLIRNIQRAPAAASQFAAGTDESFHRPPETSAISRVAPGASSGGQSVAPRPVGDSAYPTSAPFLPSADTQDASGALQPGLMDESAVPPVDNAAPAQEQQ
jgi:general secretion pathway protein D